MKVDLSKKRPNDSAAKTPVSAKKAKSGTPEKSGKDFGFVQSAFECHMIFFFFAMDGFFRVSPALNHFMACNLIDCGLIFYYRC